MDDKLENGNNVTNDNSKLSDDNVELSVDNSKLSDDNSKLSDDNSKLSDDKCHNGSDLLALREIFQKFYKNMGLESCVSSRKIGTQDEHLAILNYVEQLEEQNTLLIETLSELEKEVEKRVVQMNNRLKSSAKTTMESVINLHECREEMRRLVIERLQVEDILMNMQREVHQTTSENNFLRDQNFALNHDIQTLLCVIRHARSTGQWEMDCMTFCHVTPEQVFGPVQAIEDGYAEDEDSTHLITSNSNNNVAEKVSDSEDVEAKQNNNVEANIKKDEEETSSQEKVLQEQKRVLMTQLDSQTDELEGKKKELEVTKRQLQDSLTKIEEQTFIIKALQDALVQSKRDLDEAKAYNSSKQLSKSERNSQTHIPKTAIVDI